MSQCAVGLCVWWTVETELSFGDLKRRYCVSALIRYWVSIEDRLSLCLIRAMIIMMKPTLFSDRPTHLATRILDNILIKFHASTHRSPLQGFGIHV